MTYRGTIRNGTVVLDPGVELPDGAEVEVAVTATAGMPETATDDERSQFLHALRALLAKASFEDIVEDVLSAVQDRARRTATRRW